jgi:hypothetical protein
MRTHALVASCAALAASAISLAACGTTNSPPPSSSPSSSSQPTSSQPASPSTPATHPIACAGGWRTGSLTVTRQVAVPPVPVVTAVRTGTHPGCTFDRLVIDVSGTLPGYSVSFVPKVIQDASGRTIAMPGTRYLVIRLSPAQGHSAAGKLTLPSGVQALNFRMLKGWTVSGDFEGVLHIALGLAGGTRYRTGELGGRIFVDVAW